MKRNCADPRQEWSRAQYLIEALHKVGVAVGEAGGGEDAKGDGAAHAIEHAPVVRVRLERLDTRARNGVECLLLCAAGVAPQRAVPGVQEVARAAAVPQEENGCASAWQPRQPRTALMGMMYFIARLSLARSPPQYLPGGENTAICQGHQQCSR